MFMYIWQVNQTISDFSNERDKVVGQLKEAQVTHNGAEKDMAAAAPSGSSYFYAFSLPNPQLESLFAGYY